MRQVVLEENGQMFMLHGKRSIALPDEHIGFGLFEEGNGADDARQTIRINARSGFPLNEILPSKKISV